MATKYEIHQFLRFICSIRKGLMPNYVSIIIGLENGQWNIRYLANSDIITVIIRFMKWDTGSIKTGSILTVSWDE